MLRQIHVIVFLIFVQNFLVPQASAAGEIFFHLAADGSVELSDVRQTDDFDLLMAAQDPEQKVAGTVATGMAVSSGPVGKTLAEGVNRYRDVVADAAKVASVDSRLLHAVIAVESGFNAVAVSNKGAQGLMQLMPGTARRYGVRDIRDPAQNVSAGARYLSDLLRLFSNDISLALAAYNAGENAVIRARNQIPAYRETIAYVPKVLAVYRRLQGINI